ncbi:MAG: hypothetical protein CVV64_17830 [Candidatus Wallbacteria bacterium HGW-Wallbacteria-1]|jgi:hypothetical protein|uniref:Uncharacterized protein n=1 Tax=Candidatus Wallbacteria bacterium HGW-Wallbacteria-1 TaxID=2013854 RepID=A0A2N1PJX6_9BACT|nr:MAG: hypothetical protein CVV64_17830 [Candidatus Wallbacteria bacterium HGW-Wallbacteria-1]
MNTDLKFKFNFIDANGNTRFFLTKHGKLNDKSLELHEWNIDLSHIADTATRDNRLIIQLGREFRPAPGLQDYLLDGCALVAEIYGADARELEKNIDRVSSKTDAAKVQAALEQEGRGDQFKVCKCSNCKATVNISELPESEFIYCRYCESVLTLAGKVVTNGDQYRLCEECGMFSRVQNYTEFYFYFLLVVYGYSYKKRFMCDNCAGSMFWKMLLYNFLFIIGIIPTMAVLYKSLVGRDSALAELGKANTLAAKGRFTEADQKFRNLRGKLSSHPGILYNMSMGHFRGNDGTFGGKLLLESMKSCSNFLPTMELIQRIQKSLPDDQE